MLLAAFVAGSIVVFIARAQGAQRPVLLAGGPDRQWYEWAIPSLL